MTPVVKATCIGLLAPVLWGMSVGIVRGVTEDFGLGPGFTIMYGVAFLFLLLLFGKPPLKRFSLKYLIFGIGSANLCALCFIFSLSMAQNAEQTVQVGMVNSLLSKNHSQLGFWIARQYVVGTKLMIKKWPQVYS